MGVLWLNSNNVLQKIPFRRLKGMELEAKLDKRRRLRFVLRWRQVAADLLLTQKRSVPVVRRESKNDLEFYDKFTIVY